MNDKDEMHKLLNIEILETAKQHYSELRQTWSLLDKKAESSITVAGIFLAAIFAFMKEFSHNIGYFEKITLVGIVIFLMSTIALALAALWGRKSYISPPSESIRGRVEKLLNIKETEPVDDFINLSISLLNDFSTDWDKISDKIFIKIKKKGAYTILSQVTLFTSLVLVSVTMAIKVLIAQ
ncbi:hypothetical protein K9F62_05230 [Desulfovibrio sp. JY]|nr:hypothetical protein K9F62_05230 [Desulfovibrio sp. JY]